MSKLTSLIRRAPKRFSAIVAILASSIIVPAIAFAWGPDRPTYTVEHPADHVTFNSITNNPHVGDERNFVVVKDAANTNDGGWQDNITVQPGKEYLVRVYVHNNAADNLNLTALNTRVMASVPNTTGKNVSISGFVTADNATPNKIWDDIHFNSNQDFNLTYIPGSAEIFNNGYAAGGAGKSLPDSIVTNSGALIGYNSPDGKVPGCFEYVNYVYFKVKPQFPKEDFSVEKGVRKDNQGSFVNSINATAGEKLNYRITYKNTGNMQTNNVVLKDKLPAGVNFVPGSVKIMNANNPSGAYIKDGDKLFTSGVNIGAYTAGSNALVIYNATVGQNSILPKCGSNNLVNTATAQPEGLGIKQATASVTVNKDCPPEVTTIKVCELATKKIVTIKESDFNTNKYTKDLSKCQETPVTPITPETPPVTPETPSELPKTGMGENIVAVSGLGALIASIAYYVASRRALKQ